MKNRVTSLMVCTALVFAGFGRLEDAEAKPRRRWRGAAATLPVNHGGPSPALMNAVLAGDLKVDVGLGEAFVSRPFAKTEDVEWATWTGVLVKLADDPAFVYSPNFAEFHPTEKDNFKVAGPHVAKFIFHFIVLDLRQKFPTVAAIIESLVRSTKDQDQLRRRTRWAAKVSAHTFGCAVDISTTIFEDGQQKFMPLAVLTYVRQRLTLMEMVDIHGNRVTDQTPMADRQIQVTGELGRVRVKTRRGRVAVRRFTRAFHVVVGPKFGIHGVKYATPEMLVQK